MMRVSGSTALWRLAACVLVAAACGGSHATPPDSSLLGDGSAADVSADAGGEPETDASAPDATEVDSAPPPPPPPPPPPTTPVCDSSAGALVIVLLLAGTPIPQCNAGVCGSGECCYQSQYCMPN